SALALEQHRDAEVGQRHLTGRWINQDVGGLEVAVDDAALVDLREDLGDLDGDEQERVDRQRAAVGELAQIHAAVGLEDQDQLTTAALERERLDDAGHVEIADQLEFVL